VEDFLVWLQHQSFNIKEGTMKKISCLIGITFSLFFAGCASSFSSEPSASGPKKSSYDQIENSKDGSDSQGLRHRLVILPIVGNAEFENQEVKNRILEAFKQDLLRTGIVLPVDASELGLDLQKFYSESEYRLADIVKGSKKFGATGLLEAKIIDFQVKKLSDSIGIVRNLKTIFQAKVQVRIQNMNTNKEVFNVIKTVEHEQSDVRVAERVSADRFIDRNPELVATIIKDAFLEFTPQLTKIFDHGEWQGRIAAIQGDRIYINVGKISGIAIGDILRIAENGEQIYDPVTGQMIGDAPGRPKGTIEVVSYFGKDGAVAIMHSGAGFKENDRVEPYHQ
jgi:hypothetical protein